MPVLLWVAFWSSIMGSAACWGDARRPLKALDKAELPRDEQS